MSYYEFLELLRQQQIVVENPNLYQENDAAQDNSSKTNTVGSGWTATTTTMSSVADTNFGDYALKIVSGGDYDSAFIDIESLEIGEDYDIIVTYKSSNSTEDGAGNGYIETPTWGGWSTGEVDNFNQADWTTLTITSTADATTGTIVFAPALEDIGGYIIISKITVRKVG